MHQTIAGMIDKTIPRMKKQTPHLRGNDASTIRDHNHCGADHANAVAPKTREHLPAKLVESTDARRAAQNLRQGLKPAEKRISHAASSTAQSAAASIINLTTKRARGAALNKRGDHVIGCHARGAITSILATTLRPSLLATLTNQTNAARDAVMEPAKELIPEQAPAKQ